jgi:exonuclease SbcD
MPIRILATADLHLGKASADVSGHFAATKHTWETVVNWAIAHAVDVVALCGDIVDRDNRYFEAVGPLQDGLEKLGKHGIEVFMVSGNHDHDVLPGILRSRQLDNVHLLGANGTWELYSYTKAGETIQFAGWSFPRLIVQESAMTGWQLPGHDPNYPVIGLLHGDIDKPDSHYNPFRLVELIKQEVDLWILGHIHKPDQLRTHSPQVCYTGSPHALSAKEPGPHGPVLFTVAADKPVITERILLSPVRYERLAVNVSGCGDMMELRDLVMTSLRADVKAKLAQLEQVLAIVYQVSLTGRHARIKQVEQWAANITDLNLRLETGTNLSVRKLTCNLAAEIGDLNELALQSSMIGQLAQTILAIQYKTTTPFLDALMQDWFKKARLLTDSGTYEPLGRHKKTDELSDAVAREYILTECNRLLGELTDQVKIA